MNRLLSTIALVVLFGSLGILGYFVPRPDLIGVLTLTAVLALWDVFTSAWKR